MGLLPGHGGCVPLVPAIQLSSASEIMCVPLPAPRPTSSWFLLPAMLNITLCSSYDLEERLSQELGQQSYSGTLFRSQVVWPLVWGEICFLNFGLFKQQLSCLRLLHNLFHSPQLSQLDESQLRISIQGVSFSVPFCIIFLSRTDKWQVIPIGLMGNCIFYL